MTVNLNKSSSTKTINKANFMSSNDPTIKNLLSLCTSSLEAGNSLEAYSYANRILEMDPENSDAWFAKGKSAGWQSTLISFRFSEMIQGFNNAIKYADDGNKKSINSACCSELNEIVTSCYGMAHKHVLEFVALKESWAEYLQRCEQIISTYEVGRLYDPSNTVILENLIHLCKDNIEGIKYQDPFENNITKVVGTNESYQSILRSKLDTYAENLQLINPSYVKPDPKPQEAGCFVVTATMGDGNHPTVLLCREFRDQLLVKTSIGRIFVNYYYRYGPIAAKLIAPSSIFRFVAFCLIVLPLSVIAGILLKISKFLSKNRT